MPAEAFRDMWTTIAGGEPWSGMVKNRRKNGDHYWVMANVTPLFEGDRPAGYMSVRTQASRAQIEAAEQLYAAMRAEQSSGDAGHHRLRSGRVELHTWSARLGRRLAVRPSTRLFLLCCGCGLTGMVAGQVGQAAAGAWVCCHGCWPRCWWRARQR
jgi:aerotaxis receptor